MEDSHFFHDFRGCGRIAFLLSVNRYHLDKLKGYHLEALRQGALKKISQFGGKKEFDTFEKILFANGK